MVIKATEKSCRAVLEPLAVPVSESDSESDGRYLVLCWKNGNGHFYCCL